MRRMPGIFTGFFFHKTEWVNDKVEGEVVGFVKIERFFFEQQSATKYSLSIVFSFHNTVNDDVCSWCNMYGRYFNFILHSTSCVFFCYYSVVLYNIPLIIFTYSFSFHIHILWMKITCCSFIYRNATNSDLWNEIKYTYQVDVHKKRRQSE